MYLCSVVGPYAATSSPYPNLCNHPANGQNLRNTWDAYPPPLGATIHRHTVVGAVCPTTHCLMFKPVPHATHGTWQTATDLAQRVVIALAAHVEVEWLLQHRRKVRSLTCNPVEDLDGAHLGAAFRLLSSLFKLPYLGHHPLEGVDSAYGGCRSLHTVAISVCQRGMY